MSNHKKYYSLFSIGFAILLSVFSLQAQAISYNVSCDDSLSNPRECSGSGSDIAAARDIAYTLLRTLESPTNTCPRGALSCAVNGTALSCSGSTGSYTCTSSLYDIECSSSSCSFTINTEQCSSNANFCKGLLSRSLFCDLGFCDTEQPNREVVAETIEQYCTNESNQSGAICTLFDDPNNRDAVINALQPENLGLGLENSQTVVSEAIKFVSSHLQNLRQGPIAYSDQDLERAHQYYANEQWYNSYQKLAANDNVANDSSPTEREATINLSNDGRLSMYVNAAYLIAQQALTETSGKSKTNATTLTVGGDYRLSANTILGAALSFTDSKSEYGRSDSELNTKMFNLIAYSSFYVKQLWVDLSLSYSLNSFNQARNISCQNSGCAAINNVYKADYNGSTLSANIATGYDFTLNAWTLSPFIQINAGQNSSDAYKEAAKNSGSTLLLGIDEQKRNFTTISAGTYIRYAISTKKAVIIPTLRLVANQELKDDETTVSGRILGASNSDFVLRNTAPDSSYANIGLGLSFQLQNGNSGFFDIESTEAYENLEQYKFTAGWRWEF